MLAQGLAALPARQDPSVHRCTLGAACATPVPSPSPQVKGTQRGHHSGCDPMGEVRVEEKLKLGLRCLPRGQSLLSSQAGLPR